MTLAVKRFYLILFCLIGLSACQSPSTHRTATQPIAIDGYAMGTSYHVKFIPPDNAPQNIRLHVSTIVRDVIESIEQSMSTYRSRSELMQLNRSHSIRPIHISAPLYNVLQLSQRIGRRSEGAFDVTIHPWVTAWGFGAQKPLLSPMQPWLDKIGQHIGIDTYRLSTTSTQLTKLNPQVAFDLSAIAKGYAVDQVFLALQHAGIKHLLVEIGGEIRAGGFRKPRYPWRIGIEKPVHVTTNALLGIVELADAAMATSGDYRNKIIAGTQRFSHTINPSTGRPITHHLASVTVIAASAASADAWATALTVLGTEKGIAKAREQNLAVLFVERQEDGTLKRVASKQFRQFAPDWDGVLWL